jgi:hypothetical protein
VAQASYNEITEIEERCTDRLKSNDPDKLKDVGLNVNLHTDLLQAYYRYFLLSNKLGDTGLPATHSMLSRMWQRIQSFVEFLLPSIPHLRDYLCEFLSTAIDVAQQLLKELPAREIILMEILGDLCRFKMGIDLSKGAEWAASSRRWYGKISDKNPEIGRLYHHHAVTAGLTQLNKLFYISKALTSTERFSKAYDSAPVVFKRLLADEEVHGSDPATLRKFVKIHALFLSRAKIDYHLVGEFCGELDSHIQVVGNTFREQGVHIVLANIAAIFDFGDIGALITSMSAIQQTKAKMNDAASHYWNRRRQEGFISWNFRRASFASNLTFSTLGALLQRAGDQNVLPSVHISLAFLWCATLVPRCMEHLQADIPWSKLAFFLNSLVKPDTDIAKLASEEFPTHQNGSRKQLPEDYSLRGFAWAQLYYPDEFWNEIEDYDNRDDEFSSATMSRELCCLWLGLRIAKVSHSSIPFRE